MSVEVRITCDICCRVNENYGWGYMRNGAKPHLLRRKLKEKLAWRTGLQGGTDICYHCAQAAKAGEVQPQKERET